MKKHSGYFQGDIGFTPLAAFGKSVSAVKRNHKLRSTAHRLLIQEGESTGHHHGVWLMPQPTMLHDDALARAAADDSAINIGAQLYRDDALANSLGLDEDAPIIGFLVADTPVTIRHASIDGTPTTEHDDIELPAGGYLVTGKRESMAGDARRVQD